MQVGICGTVKDSFSPHRANRLGYSVGKKGAHESINKEKLLMVTFYSYHILCNDDRKV